MNTPMIRMVCGDCFRSLEFTGDGLSRPPAACPYCGGAFEGSAEESPELLRGLGTPPSIMTPSTGEVTQQFEAKALQQGSHVGRFQILETLGGGGFGQVHRAYDPRLDRDVALKVLKDAEPGARVMERFFREARAAARLEHPNIVAMHDAGRDGGVCWIAYQYIAGRNLHRLQEQGPIELSTAVQLVRSLADALDHAHRRGVYHRDLKPSNVIIDQAGRPRLTDFGLARRVDFESTLTREGTVLGTPAYMSPEQAQGRSHMADARSDVYSLGVVLYELICGRRPVELPSGVPAWRAAQAPAAPPPRSVNRAIPLALDRICQRALAQDPDDRYPDVRALSYELDRWINRGKWFPRSARALGGLAAATLAGASICLAGVATIAARRTTTDAHIVGPQTVAQAPEPGTTPRQSVATIAPVTASPPVADESVVGNRSSHVYHRPTCASAVAIIPSHRVVFAAAAGANDRGYTACSRCLPGSAR